MSHATPRGDLSHTLIAHAKEMRAHVARVTDLVAVACTMESDALPCGSLGAAMEDALSGALCVHSDEEVSCDELPEGFTYFLADAFLEAVTARAADDAALVGVSRALLYSRKHALVTPSLHERLGAALLHTLDAHDAHLALLHGCVGAWQRTGECKVCRTQGVKRARRDTPAKATPLVRLTTLLVNALREYVV